MEPNDLIPVNRATKPGPQKINDGPRRKFKNLEARYKISVPNFQQPT